MALFGLYHRLTPHAAATWLARLHAGTAIAGVLVMVPGIAMAITIGQPTLAAVGALLTALSMAIFLFTVLRHGLGEREYGGAGGLPRCPPLLMDVDSLKACITYRGSQGRAGSIMQIG